MPLLLTFRFILPLYLVRRAVGSIAYVCFALRQINFTVVIICNLVDFCCFRKHVDNPHRWTIFLARGSKDRSRSVRFLTASRGEKQSGCNYVNHRCALEIAAETRENVTCRSGEGRGGRGWRIERILTLPTLAIEPRSSTLDHHRGNASKKFNAGGGCVFSWRRISESDDV